MTDYTKATDFRAKDEMLDTNPAKVIRGSEFDTEFNNIQAAVNSKSNTASPTFTGTVSFGDDVKAVFGAGADLEIFHDGTDSIISDNGTGTLKLRQGLNDRLSLKAGGVTVHGEVNAATGDFLSTQTGTLRIETSQTILSGGSVGTAGDITWDNNYLYICVATNTWKRVTLNSIPDATF